MHAIVIRDATATSEAPPLEYTRVPDPAPATGEVIVDVAASALNRADLLQRRGLYPPPAGESQILGLECSGVISAIGEGVKGWSIGDEVCALLAGGGYAERVAVPAGQLLPIPSGVSLVDAAALPEAACTVWVSLVLTARLSPGDRLLVHGGAGGIGTMALQLGRLVGAEVYCTARSSKADACRGLGAHRVIDYETEDFTQELGAVGGAHVVLDTIGAKYVSKNLAALALEGRIVVIGLQGGRRGEIDLGELLQKRATISGTVLRSRSRDEKARIVEDVRDHVWPAIASGYVRPVVDRVFALGDALEAHAYMEQGKHIGKLLLVP